MTEEDSPWSRYFKMDCPDIIFTMKTDGPEDDRPDPPNLTFHCLMKEHGEHPVVRISREEYEELHSDDEDE
jgi:hypothetical protein